MFNVEYFETFYFVRSFISTIFASENENKQINTNDYEVL